MKALYPKLDGTKVGNAPWEWLPDSFDHFLDECENLVSHCNDLGHLVLFRGQRDRKWLLDSTFARTCKRMIFGINPWEKLRFEKFRLSEVYQQVLVNLFFFKFDFVARPSQELENLEDTYGIDPWFEFMKRLQQYPEEDNFHLKGSFIVDGTQNLDVAIYFANESRSGEGALWIADVTATGKTLQVLKVREILQKMADAGSRNESLGLPLIFHLTKQLAQKRAANQNPVYIAQMDLRADLSEVWDDVQNQNNDKGIFFKIVLPAGTEEECAQYLDKRGLTKSFIFPD